MLVVVYDDVGEVAFRIETQRDALALCPRRPEKAHVVELCRRRRSSSWMDRHCPDSRAFRRHVFDKARIRARHSGKVISPALWQSRSGERAGVRSRLRRRLEE